MTALASALLRAEQLTVMGGNVTLPLAGRRCGALKY